MSSKGGVAIFVKDNLKVFDRLVLNSNEKSFEATRIELNCDKSKNYCAGGSIEILKLILMS